MNITEWCDTKIEHHNTNSIDKSCVVVIPAYKNDLLKSEECALKQVVKVLGKKYEIVLVCPPSLDIDQYNNCANYSFSFMRCSNAFFKSQKTYSDLCEHWKFYNTFNDYVYMLLYQLDAWIFEDRLDYFVKMGYDYMGAPHLIGFGGRKEGENGNGGFSLRKIKTFIDVCKKTDFSKIPPGQLEDCAFTQVLKNHFNLAPLNICRQFSFQDMPSTQYQKNGNKLPMGCHAWKKFNSTFWRKYIPEEAWVPSKTKKEAGNIISAIYGDDVVMNLKRKIEKTGNSAIVNKKVLIRKFR